MIADVIISTLKLWGLAGLMVAGAFLTVGIGHIDEDARDAVGFRPLLVPAIIVLWPLVLWRWWTLFRGKDNWRRRHTPPRQAHAWVSVFLALTLLVVLAVSFAVQQSWPAQIAPVQIALPEDQ